MRECMTQEDAERMDANQAIQILKPLRAMMLDQYGCPISAAYFALGKAIEALEQPTVDAVPVVRCRECKHYEEAKLNVITSHDKVCAYAIDHRFYREPDDFCSKGERKGGDE